jgi:ribosomal protein S18 acetylase RimI-like enzyme
MSTAPEITALTFEEAEAGLSDLTDLMHACVLDGASIGYIVPFSRRQAEEFWTRKIFPALRGGGLLVLAARQEGRIVGSVQLDHDTPPNQPHRAEIRKLLVHPDHRRRGIARALMRQIESHALRLSRTLLTLDTRTGDTAEPLYASLGYATAGILPGWCRDTLTDRLDATTFMYKTLGSTPPSAHEQSLTPR